MMDRNHSFQQETTIGIIGNACWGQSNSTNQLFISQQQGIMSTLVACICFCSFCCQDLLYLRFEH